MTKKINELIEKITSVNENDLLFIQDEAKKTNKKIKFETLASVDDSELTLVKRDASGTAKFKDPKNDFEVIRKVDLENIPQIEIVMSDLGPTTVLPEKTFWFQKNSENEIIKKFVSDGSTWLEYKTNSLSVQADTRNFQTDRENLEDLLISVHRKTKSPQRVYVASFDNSVHVVDCRTGTRILRTTAPSSDVFGVAVDDEGCFYSGEGNGTIRKYSPSGGTLWSNTAHSDIVFNVAVRKPNKHVFSVSSDNFVRRFSETGTLLDSENLNTTGRGLVLSSIYLLTGAGASFRRYSASALTLHWSDGAGGTVYDIRISQSDSSYVLARASTVQKRESSSVSSPGGVIWTTSLGSPVWAVATTPSGVIYAGGDNQALVKLSENGSILWTRSVGSNIRGVDTDEEGFVYFGDSSGNLRKFDPDGNLIWLYKNGSHRLYRVAVSPGSYSSLFWSV